AISMLSIAPMSSELGRIFSRAGILVTPRRNRLLSDIIEVYECLRLGGKVGVIRIGKYRDTVVELEAAEEEEAADRAVGVDEYGAPGRLVTAFRL
ncbi:hypothetical protein K469DRAFT_556276, partial [Zopfia rhizophila CBS 207.26]